MRAILRRAIRQAFLALGDIPVKATYKVKTSDSVYDPETGTSSTPSQLIDLPLVAFTRFTVKEMDRDPKIAAKDVKVLFPMEDLGREPSEDDTVIDNKGREWEIVRVLGEPSEQLGMLQCRLS
ncbi:hypothetical protein GURKE_03560 [Brevundimonas phage vB_BpoS-Gurke]|uniref:Uncharacterized protein n=1 Tax=Brevundimonas phage vB_BpoS-Gurke TaxID=2948599 RepID=A0A9E7N4K4_9CAUD|nr:hypothetical protein GURKE_03560 [Brevundimonas phage vB_BpoS-Gurke]